MTAYSSQNMGKMMQAVHRKLGETQRAAQLVTGIITNTTPGTAIDKINVFNRAIEASRPEAGMKEPKTALIPADGFWSSEQGRAVTREQVMAWAVRDYDIAEGDRFWVAPKRFIGLTCVNASQRSWMIAAYIGGKPVGSEDCSSAFELMVHFDFWVEKLRDPNYWLV